MLRLLHKKPHLSSKVIFSKKFAVKRHKMSVRFVIIYEDPDQYRKNGGETLKCQMSESEKAELLFALYEQEMYRVCLAILGDPYTAEDAVSESFLKLLKNRDRIADPRDDSCRRYVIKTAKNTAIDMYRKKAREREILEDLPENQVSDVPLTDDMSPIDTEDVLERLSKKYRDVIVCMCINGLTVRETSAVLKVSEACVRKRLERARHQLESIRKNV